MMEGTPLMTMVDCHAHLADDSFDHDIEDVIGRAKEKGVGAALVVSIRPADFEKVMQLEERFPDFVVPCLGVHPVQGIPGDQRCVAMSDLEEAIPVIEKYHARLGAIGEIGLDLQPRWCPTPEAKDIQRQVLIKQIELAKKYDLPINVHSRSAGRPTIALLKEQGATRVLLHAFDGNPKVAMEGAREGYFFSIPPSIVRSEQKQTLVHKLPIENMLLETDSPALGPVKEGRNEPCNVQLSCEYIAQVKQMDSAEVRRITTQNALKLFPKLARLFPR